MIIMDKDTRKRLEFFGFNYDIITRYNLKDIKSKKEKIFLGNKTNRVCRFCGRREPEVTFEEEAHAIPNLIGNQMLFTYYECDACNTRFCKTQEKHLANFLGTLRTYYGIRGKKRIPQYDKSNTKIFKKNGMLIVQTISGNEDELLKFDRKNKKITINTKKDTYIPLAVYKCFVKMAMSIITEDELDNLHWVIAWLDDKMKKKYKFNIKPLNLYFAFTPGLPVYEGIDVFLFRRKKVFEYKVPLLYSVPYIIFVIRFKNFVYQICIPENDNFLDCNKSICEKKNYNCVCFPGASTDLNKVKYGYEDFSSEDFIDRNSTETFEFSYGDIIEGESVKVMAEKILRHNNKK